MLYATTRNNVDAYTCARALNENRGSDGGLYVPFRLPAYTEEEIADWANLSDSAVMAQVLNRLFGTRLTAWDVEFAAGRHCVRTRKLSTKIIAAELWHNTGGSFSWMVSALSRQMSRDATDLAEGTWREIGIRMAALAGIFAGLIREGMASPDKKVDLSVVSGDFSAPMSAWYAREMGLPIGNIICTCNENNAIWDLWHHGQLRTDLLSIPTSTSEADVMLPLSLERLIHAAGGSGEVLKYLSCCHAGRMYCPNDAVLSKLRKGMFVSVVGQRRVERTIPSVLSSMSYLLSPYGALAYSGLLDYRVKTGESRHALVLTEKSPMLDSAVTAAALGIPESQLERLI